MIIGKKKTPPDPLERVLLAWGGDRRGRDVLTARDALTSVAIFGRTGSGKTSGSGLALLRALVSDGNVALLILAAKPEDGDEVRRVYRVAGMEDRLIEFTPGGEHRCNVFDVIAKMGGGARELTAFMSRIREAIRTNDAKGGEDSKFWEDEADRKIYNAAIVIKLAFGKVTADYTRHG